MKLVISKCFGGFSLSPAAIKRLAELKGKPCYFFTGGIGGKPLTPTDDPKGLFFSAFSIPDPSGILADQEAFFSLTPEEKDEANRRYREVSLDQCPKDRSDPHLVQVVEELGAAASGSLADLRVVEIPAGPYEIYDYDGVETVERPREVLA